MGFHGTAANTVEAARPDTGRRAVRTLWAACVVGGFAQSLTGTASSLLAHEVGGPSAAGLPQTAQVAGAAAAAALAGRLTASFGRAPTLAAGAAAAAAGSLVVVSGALVSVLALIVAGSALLGAGGAAVMLCRYAAAETATEAMRPKAMASVLTATTIGAVAGPNLLAPASRAAEGLGLPVLSGAYVFGAASFALMAVVIMAGPRSRPAAGPAALPGGPVQAASAAPGLAVLALSNLVMIAVMTMTPVQMDHTGGGFVGIGLMVSAHIAGMFAPAPVSARLVTRFGARRAAALAGAVMAGACVLAVADARSAVVLAVAMTLLGAGWNLGLVSGSSLLTASLPRELRLRRESLGEVVMGVAAAVGGLACGPVMALGGYTVLAAGGAVAAALIPGLVGRLERRLPPYESGRVRGGFDAVAVWRTMGGPGRRETNRILEGNRGDEPN